MLELVKFISSKKDYVIFGGFGAFLHTGVKSSADIDVFVKDVKQIGAWGLSLLHHGWKITRKSKMFKTHRFISMQKNKTTFDIHWSDLALKAFMSHAVTINYLKYHLQVLGIEEMFLCKVQVLIETKRNISKVQRDKQVISLLKCKLNDHKLKLLLCKLPSKFWSKGYF